MSDVYTLDPQTEAAVKAGVASGRYASAAVLLKQAVDLLDDRDRRRQALDLALDRGIADVEAGRDYDLDEVFDELEARYASPEVVAPRS